MSNSIFRGHELLILDTAGLNTVRNACCCSVSIILAFLACASVPPDASSVLVVLSVSSTVCVCLPSSPSDFLTDRPSPLHDFHSPCRNLYSRHVVMTVLQPASQATLRTGGGAVGVVAEEGNISLVSASTASHQRFSFFACKSPCMQRDSNSLTSCCSSSDKSVSLPIPYFSRISTV